MALVAIDDHVSRALARVRLQFRDSADVLGMLGALATEVQAVEDGLNGLRAALRDYNAATGKTLEEIGKVVSSPARGLRTDAELRSAVGASVIRNGSFGRIKDVFDLLYNLFVFYGFWGDAPLIIEPLDGPGSSGLVGGDCVIVVESIGGIGESPVDFSKLQEAMTFLQALAPAGVRVILASPVTPLASFTQMFTFDGVYSPLDQGFFYTAIDRV